MKLLTLFLVVLCKFTIAEDVEQSEAGTTVKVLGQSGKIRVEHAGSPVTIDFDSLSEISATGAVVGNEGANKHSVNSFATQNFVFTPVVEEPYLGVPVKKFTFESPIYSIGHLRIVCMLIQENATINTGTEAWDVSKGDMKFNIELRDWTFCSPCSDGIAEFVEINIEIKSNKEITEGESKKTVDLGGAQMQLAQEVTVDDAKVVMPSGFPKVISKGSKQIFVFRFPKFSNALSYDPLLQLNPNTSNAQKLTIKVFTITLIALTVALFS